MKTTLRATPIIFAGLLAACQMPAPRSGLPAPSGPSAPSGQPAPTGQPSPPGPSSPADPGATASPAGSPPPAGSPGGAEGLPSPPGEGPSPEPGGGEAAPPGSGDSIEGLDERLDEALEDFDESVTGAGNGSGQEEIDILDPLGGGGAGIEGDEPLFEEGDPGEGAAAENDELAQRAADGASGGGGGAPPPGQQGSGSGVSGAGQDGADDVIPIPDDIGDGRNDDIVMRQVRDAAMKERDPVLRERLWDEYRRIRDQK